ncbi:Inactive palmitoleoyl-protein carboxylesterase notum1b, partial [Fragariocoptes setiger]
SKSKQLSYRQELSCKRIIQTMTRSSANKIDYMLLLSLMFFTQLAIVSKWPQIMPMVGANAMSHYQQQNHNHNQQNHDLSTSFSLSQTLSSQNRQSVRLNHEHLLQRHWFNNTKAHHDQTTTTNDVTCNDGSPAGYYLRPSPNGSTRWIIFLEGGWHCFNARSCQQRWQKSRELMTSTRWPELKSGSGILSANREENPHWWDANHVFVPYCSSDSWS